MGLLFATGNQDNINAESLGLIGLFFVLVLFLFFLILWFYVLYRLVMFVVETLTKSGKKTTEDYVLVVLAILVILILLGLI